MLFFPQPQQLRPQQRPPAQVKRTLRLFPRQTSAHRLSFLLSRAPQLDSPPPPPPAVRPPPLPHPQPCSPDPFAPTSPRKRFRSSAPPPPPAPENLCAILHAGSPTGSDSFPAALHPAFRSDADSTLCYKPGFRVPADR